MKQHLRRISSVMLLLRLSICLSSAWVYAADPILFNDNGVWCWFQDERAIVHNGKLIVGSVADASGTDGAARNGNVEVVEYDIAAEGPAIRIVLHANYQADDHAAPAFLALPDNRILTMYSKHGSDNLIRYRITTHPNDATGWDSEMTISRDAGVTYSNVYRLSTENGGSGRIYNFYRGEDYNPNFVTSDNNGQTWTYGLPGVSTDGRLIAIGSGGTRPYVKYASNHVDKIHFITTEGHPRDYNNSIYYGYLYRGNLYAADGTWLHDTADGGIAPQSLEKIYQGGVNNVAWTTDMDLDAYGNPYFAFSVQMNQDMYDLRYGYARWDGSQWHVHEMAYAGSALYSAESDYPGLVALDPNNPNIVYISADVHPVTGQPLISSADGLRHYELFRGTTADMGATWQWGSITKNSTQDNIRPIIPEWDGGTILLWCRGTYWSYTNWDMDIVGLINPQPIVSYEPQITDQPDSTAAPIGGTAIFTVQAIGLEPLSYAWYTVDSGGDIPVGENSSHLILMDIQVSDMGQYYCQVSNTAGSAVSASASLMIADLSAYWPLDGTYDDVTDNGYDASAAGTPSFTGGHTNQAVSLGGGSYLNCANSADLTLAEGGTLSAWVKTGGLSNPWASVVTKGRYGWRLCRNNTSNAISFHFNSPSYEYQADGDIPVVDNNWHHLAATYDGQSINLYVDGQLDASSSTSEAVNELTDLVYIGSRSDNPTGRYWDGLIDEVRIYSFAMDEKTIELLYEQDKSCYRLDPYDRNKDCRISLADLDLFLGSWLDDGLDPQTSVCSANPELDLTGPDGTPDCIVDLYDFAGLAFRWLDCTLLPSSDCP